MHKCVFHIHEAEAETNTHETLCSVRCEEFHVKMLLVSINYYCSVESEL